MNIIIEEDEPRSASPMSYYSDTSSQEGSSNLTLKAKRRHATLVSDIRLSRVFPTDDCLLSSPRPAPHPPSTFDPLPSPDSFKLIFTDLSYKFPHPPIPTPTSLRKYDRDSECVSPTSSLSSSPASQADDMPLTPSTSDDEFTGPSIRSRQRPVIQPLVITKHNPRPSSPFDDDDCPISPSLLQPFKNATESSIPISPLSPSYLAEAFFDVSDEDSDPESDSEWYSKELSKIISPNPPSFPHQTARPESISIPSSVFPFRRRASKPLPPTPSSGGFSPNAQLDPTFPQRKRRSLPKYPPPPVPNISPSSSLPTPTSSSPSNPNFNRRPPPRSSVPADCVYDLVDLEDLKEDNSSAFSFSIYDVYLGDEPVHSHSHYQEGEGEDPIDNVSFDLDCSMMLPLSLPTTPFDLEADIAHGLEQLRNSPVIDGNNHRQTGFIIPEIREPERKLEPQRQQQDIFSPNPTPTTSEEEEKVLKSRWSTSSLGSVREEQQRRVGASSKLRLYFSPLKNQHKQGLKKSSTTSSSSSSSPSPSRSTHHHHHHLHHHSKTPASPIRSLTRAHMRGNSDVMVIGYGNNGNGNGNNGVRRRGSVSNNSVSDAGSEESNSSSSSSGLRRKPIPVEMFLRSAA